MTDPKRLAEAEWKVKYKMLADDYQREIEAHRQSRAVLAMVATDVEGVWLWQGDAHDHLKSLTAPIVMSAETLRQLVGPSADDKPIPEDADIEAAHPLAQKPPRHDLYAQALRMVGAKHSKYALVDLVHWLLSRYAQLQDEVELVLSRPHDVRQALDALEARLKTNKEKHG